VGELEYSVPGSKPGGLQQKGAAINRHPTDDTTASIRARTRPNATG